MNKEYIIILFLIYLLTTAFLTYLIVTQSSCTHFMSKEYIIILFLIYLLTTAFLIYLIVIQSFCIQDLKENYSVLLEKYMHVLDSQKK